MSKEEVEIMAKAKKEELGVTDKSKIGILIGAIMKETKGKADGSVVKEVVNGLFLKQKTARLWRAVFCFLS